MSARFVSTIGVLLLAASAHAQPVQKTLPSSAPVFQLLSTQATTQESPFVQAVVARVRARFTSDAAFSRRVNDAIVRRDFAGARSLVAAVAQLPDTQVVIGLPRRSSARYEERALVRFASYDRAAASMFNPFYILITTENHAICFGLKATCVDAIRKAGYEPNV